MDDVLVTFGGEIKSLGGGRIAGHLVRFSDASEPDISAYRDFFTKSTDFGIDEWPAKVGLYYNHGLDPDLRKRRIGTGTLKMTDAGLWYEAQLKQADDFDAMVWKLAEAGRLRFSSGAAGHLVEREAVKNEAGETIAHELKQWIIAEASATVHPAEPGCRALALKSLDLPALREQFSTDVPARLGTGRTLAEHSHAVVSAVTELTDRLEDRAAFRLATETKSGRVLSAANVAEIESVLTALQGITETSGRLTALLEKARPKQAEETTADNAAAPPERLPRLETLRLQTQLLGQQLGASQ